MSCLFGQSVISNNFFFRFCYDDFMAKAKVKESKSPDDAKALSGRQRVKGRGRSFAVGFIIAFSIILNSYFLIPAYAQVSVGGVANNLVVADSKVKTGDIVVQTDKGIVRSTVPFDPRMLGVVVEFPVMSSGLKTDNTKSIMSSGRATVNVTATHGIINEGDFVTSSDKAGVGQKADIQGYILGKAMASYKDTKKDGQIPVLVNMGSFSPGLNVAGALGALMASLITGFQNTQNFPIVLRYVLAFLISLITLVISSTTFVRFMRHGLEAIGRNPLAKKTIVSGMILNAVITAVLTIAGFGIAVAIVAF